MDSSAYLKSYGWKEGTALKNGGLRKPILVKHKKDTKGLGHNTNEHEAWWERVFDGQLKSLDIASSSAGEVSFKQGEVKVSAISQHASPLYRMFVRGGLLQGTLETKPPIGDKSKAESESESDSRSDSGSKLKTRSKSKSKSKSKSSKDKKGKSRSSEKTREKKLKKVKEAAEKKAKKNSKKEKEDKKIRKSSKSKSK